MLVSSEAWDPYRVFCLSAASSTISHSTSEFQETLDAEVQDRLGLVEDYLAEWNALQRGLPRFAAQACRREQQRFCADEAEERRFIEEDSAYLAYRAFAEQLWNDALCQFVNTEEEARRAILNEFNESYVANVFQQHERVHRMRVTCEALDSLALKACHVGRTGLRDEGRLARTSVPGHAYAASPFALTPRSSLSDSGRKGSFLHRLTTLVLEREEEERELIHEAWWGFVAVASLVQRRCRWQL